MNKNDTHLICYDLEFTSPTYCRAMKIPIEPMEIGAVKLDVVSMKNTGETFSQIVRPINMAGVTDEVLDLTGITRRDLDKAPYFADVWKRWHSFTGKSRLASWTGIDNDVLRNAYSLCEVTWPHHRNPMDAMSFTMGVFHAKNMSAKSFGLKAVSKYFGLPLPSHRALDDALAMSRILQVL